MSDTRCMVKLVQFAGYYSTGLAELIPITASKMKTHLCSAYQHV